MNNFETQETDYEKILNDCTCIFTKSSSSASSCTKEDKTEYGEKPGEYILCSQVLKMTDVEASPQYINYTNGN